MKARYWGIIAVILVVLDVVIPFYFLKDVSSIWGSYAYWVLLTLTVIIIGILSIRKWGDQG